MTQHIMQTDTLEDQQTMRRLATVIGCFVAATAIMAVTIAALMG